MEKKLLHFFIAFGCWFAAWGNTTSFIIYNIWATVVWVWCIATGIALFSVLTKEKTRRYACVAFNESAIYNGFLLSAISVVSYILAGEMLLAVAVLMTAMPFMITLAYIKENVAKKKKRK